MNNEIFKEYLDIEETLKIAEGRKKELKGLLLEEMKKAELQNVDVEDRGTFYIRTSKKYTFSDVVESQEKQAKKDIKEYSEPLLKQVSDYEENRLKTIESIKAEEIETGTAKVEETSSVNFRKK